MAETEKGLEKSKSKYARAGRGLGRIAESFLKRPLPENVIRQWESLFVSIRVLDDRIDRTEDVSLRAAISEDMYRFVVGEDVSPGVDDECMRALEDVRTLVASLSADRKEQFASTLHEILVVTERIKVTPIVPEFIALTRKEGALTVDLLLPFIPASFQEQEKYPQFVEALELFAQAGNLADSAIDLPSDVRAGQAKISPNIMNRLRLARAASIDLAVALARSGIKLSFQILKKVPQWSLEMILDIKRMKKRQKIVRSARYTVSDGRTDPKT